MNEFAEVLQSVRKSPLRYRIVQRACWFNLRLNWWLKYRHIEPPF